MLNETKMVTGFNKNGEATASLCIDDRIDPEKEYRMVFQVEKEFNVLKTKVDLSFDGMKLIARTLNRKAAMKAFHSRNQISTPFDFWFRHEMKSGVIIYCYTKIFGYSPKTQKLIKRTTGWRYNMQKAFLKNRELVEEVLCSYLFLKIEEGFDSVIINDRFGMTEAEVDKFLEKADYDKETLVHGYGGDIEAMRRCLRAGYLQSIPFNTSISTVETVN